MTILDEMVALARKARSVAYAPYSHFCVGACLRTIQNNLYTGCNVENASYGLTICAEVSAIGNMVVAGEQDIKDIVVVGPDTEAVVPCGRCRQMVFEFSSEQTSFHLCNASGILKSVKIGDLLPFAFSRAMLEKP